MSADVANKAAGTIGIYTGAARLLAAARLLPRVHRGGSRGTWGASRKLATLPVRMFWRQRHDQRRQRVGTITTTDGTEIFYKDWGSGQPIVFRHGWALSADDWDTQMLFFLRHGYRVIAHDRRGHGRSTQTSNGHDMDHYADDLAALTKHLDLKNAIHVGHSTGGGEVVHYVARHGESRVAKAAIIAAVPPLMVKTPAIRLVSRSQCLMIFR